MRVDPDSASRLGMLVDRYLPGCGFLNVHTVDVEVDPATVWERLPGAVAELTPKGFFALMLRLAALMRGKSRQRSASVELPSALHEGQKIVHDPPDSLVIERIQEGREIVLKGSHRYAEFFANFYLEPLAPAGTRVYNVTRANFSRSPLGKLYFRGVRVFHDPIVEWGLRRLKRILEGGRL